MISVIIPVMNESDTIASVVSFAIASPNVSEVIVVDDGSIDGTPELAAKFGARIITSTLLGKGVSMDDGTRAAKNDIILFLDGDLSELCDDLVERMTAPLFQDEADFVKARFTRVAGRVTTLTARPLIDTFFPELANIEQPLGGIIAARRSILRNLRFETDYGVDVGLLLDVAVLNVRLVQVDIGHIQHDEQPLETLGDMAKQVVRVILDRAFRYGRLDVQQFREVNEVERHTQAELSVLLGKLDQSEKIALIDMDGTLLHGRFVVTLAERTQKTAHLNEFLDHLTLEADERTQRIGHLFADIPKSVFEDAARSIPLAPGAAELVVGLRKRGYRVGIVTDSFLVAAEIIRRRVFADFAIAHIMKFRHGIATGEVTLSLAMRHDNGCKQHVLCKSNVLLHIGDYLGLSREKTLAVGGSNADVCMLKSAGNSIAFRPKSKAILTAARYVVYGSLVEILSYLDSQEKMPNN